MGTGHAFAAEAGRLCGVFLHAFLASKATVARIGRRRQERYSVDVLRASSDRCRFYGSSDVIILIPTAQYLAQRRMSAEQIADALS